MEEFLLNAVEAVDFQDFREYKKETLDWSWDNITS